MVVVLIVSNNTFSSMSLPALFIFLLSTAKSPVSINSSLLSRHSPHCYPPLENTFLP
jgi:hypothetical protein